MQYVWMPQLNEKEHQKVQGPQEQIEEKIKIFGTPIAVIDLPVADKFP